MPKTRFKELRKQRKLTQEELISQFNERYGKQYTASSISMFENNKRIPETQALMDFADFYGVSVDYLLGRTDIPEPLPPYINKNLTPPQVTPQVIPDILTPDERECIRKYRALTDDQRGAIKNQIDYFYTKSISEDSAKDGAS